MSAKKTKRLPLLFFTCTTALLSPGLAIGGAGDGANTYGLGPMNAGTALAFSPFASNSWSVYYNPAAMARSPEGELGVIVQYGDQELRAKSLGGTDPLERENDILSDTSSELLLIGFKSRVAGISSIDKPIYFGLNVGVDQYTSNLLPYQANTSQKGQFLRYESQPLYLAFGGAISNVLRGVDVGASARLTLQAKANLEAVSDLGGNTDSEKLSLEASPSLSPALGINIRSGEMFCGTSECMPFGMDKMELALFWRGERGGGEAHRGRADGREVAHAGAAPRESLRLLTQPHPDLCAEARSTSSRLRSAPRRLLVPKVPALTLANATSHRTPPSPPRDYPGVLRTSRAVPLPEPSEQSCSACAASVGSSV